jgi:hypothetical protein
VPTPLPLQPLNQIIKVKHGSKNYMSEHPIRIAQYLLRYTLVSMKVAAKAILGPLDSITT